MNTVHLTDHQAASLMNLIDDSRQGDLNRLCSATLNGNSESASICAELAQQKQELRAAVARSLR